MALITYATKVTINPLPDVPAINKVTDADMNEIKTAVNQNALRDWDNTQNKFPDSGGSGTAGAIKKNNWFIGSGIGNWETGTGLGSEQVNDGAIFIARVDNPGQTPANWRYIG